MGLHDELLVEMKLYTRLATIINSVSARSRAVFVISWLWIIDKTLFLSLPRSIDFRSRLFELTSSLNVLLPYFQQVSLHLPPPPVKIFFHAYPLPLFSFQNNHAPPVEYSISNKRLARYCCSDDPFFLSFHLFYSPRRRNEREKNC